MLSKKIHIEQVERFHNELKRVNDLIEKYKDDPDEKELVYELLMRYMELNKIWTKIDDFIEFVIKHELDVLKNES